VLPLLPLPALLPRLSGAGRVPLGGKLRLPVLLPPPPPLPALLELLLLLLPLPLLLLLLLLLLPLLPCCCPPPRQSRAHWSQSGLPQS